MGFERLRKNLLLLLVLALSSVFIFRYTRTGEFSYNIDESEHANTGLYVASLLRDLPLRHPVQYTYSYYGHYPDLGLVHWPPLFYAAEGTAFRVAGASVLSAHMVVAAFALLALAFWFQLLAELHGQMVAAMGTLLLALAPFMLLFEKVVMLEVPAIAFTIAAVYFWRKYLEQEEPRYLYWFALMAAAGLLTKQAVIFLAPFCLLTLLATNKLRLLATTAMARALAIVLVLVGPFYWLVFRVHLSTVKDIVMVSSDNSNAFAYYWKALPQQLGWPLLLLSIFGMATCYFWGKRETVLIMLCWIISCYVMFSLVSTRTPRYAIYWIPAFIYFAVAPAAAFKKWGLRWASVAALAGVELSLVVLAWNYQRPYVAGYAPAAARVEQLQNSGVVVYDGPLPGDFIFYMRLADPGLRYVVLRKALYVQSVDKNYGGSELLHTSADLLDLFRRDGIRYIVVCNYQPLEYPIQKTLRDLLQDEKQQFRLLERFPIQSNQSTWKGRELLLYENTQATSPTDKYIHIRMLTLNHDIEVALQ